MYCRNRCKLNSDLPYVIYARGARWYNGRFIDIKGCDEYLYRIGERYCFYETGTRMINGKSTNILGLWN